MENIIDSSSLKIEPLKAMFYDAGLAFIKHIFSAEQNIPVEIIPVNNQLQKWWCIRHNEMILGTAVAWKTNSEWYWGRFAVDKRIRGLGFGKKLAIRSFNDLFKTGVTTVKIDSRDITIAILLALGGKITGTKSCFYGHPITPVELQQNDFFDKVNYINTGH